MPPIPDNETQVGILADSVWNANRSGRSTGAGQEFA